MTEVICAVVTGIFSVVVSIIGINVKRSSTAAERQAKLREKESLLSLHMIGATLDLSVVTSNALTGGHNNGNVERAREAAEKAAAEYEEFMREITVHEVGK